jgi:hypothetical protein
LHFVESEKQYGIAAVKVQRIDAAHLILGLHSAAGAKQVCHGKFASQTTGAGAKEGV